MGGTAVKKLLTFVFGEFGRNIDGLFYGTVEAFL
jgi:hypothetical protein